MTQTSSLQALLVANAMASARTASLPTEFIEHGNKANSIDHNKDAAKGAVSEVEGTFRMRVSCQNWHQGCLLARISGAKVDGPLIVPFADAGSRPVGTSPKTHPKIGVYLMGWTEIASASS